MGAQMGLKGRAMRNGVTMRSRNDRRRGAAGRRRGQSLVELALLLPMLTLIIVGTLDLARVFATTVRLTNAVKEGALYAAAANPEAPGNLNDIRSHAYNEAAGQLGVVGTDFVITSVTCDPSCQQGNELVVTGRTTFRPFLAQAIRFWGTSKQLTRVVRVTIVSYIP